jgi:transposase-like protein
MINTGDIKFCSVVKFGGGGCPKCHNDLKETQLGFPLGHQVYVCPECEIVFELKLRKIRDKYICKESLEKFLNKIKVEK